MSELDFSELESESINIKGLILKYLRYWYLFVLTVMLCMAGAFLYLRYSTPLYSISSTMLVQDDTQGASFALNDMGMFESSKGIENEIIVLKSKSLMERVIAELPLQTSYYVEGRVKTIEAYGKSQPVNVVISRLDSAAYGKSLTLSINDNNTFELIDDQGTSTHSFGKEINKSYGAFTVLASPGVSSSGKTVVVKFHDRRKLAEFYNNKLIVAPFNKSASVLVLSMVDAVPEKGRDIINKVAEVYSKEIVDNKRILATSTIDFIDDRLKYLTEELSEVEKEVETFKRSNELVDVEAAGGLYVSSEEAYNKQLAELAIQIDILASIENYIRRQDNQYEAVPSTLTISDPTLNGLIANFNQLQLERQRVLRSATPNNPIVQNLNEQLVNLRGNILENLKNIRQSLGISRNNLQAEAAQFRSKRQQVPAMEREMLEISRQQSIKSGLYLYLLQKREETAISLAAIVSNARVIDPATAGDVPVEPKPQMIYLIALLAGLAIPFAGITAKNMLNDKVELLKEVEQATRTPILGELNHTDTESALVVTGENRTAIAEQFRLIRSNLQFATGGKENKVILVTSSMSGEGKTFFSINLAASLMLTGKKVVIVGFDLRKPKLTQDLGLSNSKGITNYLISDSLTVDELLMPVPGANNLYLLAGGPIPPNPGELIMHPKISDLFFVLRTKFDYVIVDTAPVGQVADTLALAPYIDSSIYLVRYNYTVKAQLAIVDDVFRNKKLKHPMIVLNDAKENNSSGYGYGYGYGYGEEEKVSGGWLSKFRK